MKGDAPLTYHRTAFFYDQANGEGEFYPYNGATAKFSGGPPCHKGLRKTWTKVIPLPPKTPGGLARVLFYDAATGEAEMVDQNMKLITPFKGWRKTWHTIVHVPLSAGQEGILFFEALSGDAELYHIKPDNSWAHVKNHKWRKTWDYIQVLKLGGKTSLLFYDRESGEAELYYLNDNGTIPLVKKFTGWRKTWHSIIPLHWHDRYGLMFYDNTKGEAEFYFVKPDGTFEFAKTDKVPTDWDIVIPAGNRVLFYNRARGHGEIYRVDSHTHLVEPEKHHGWRKTWNNIILLE
eukprot:TRINITY_DN21744_c0_g3_i1.p1 TRINITY_DN21744_c0_g3~~TRINITY_DN21744_c0_g3_i1.p1  ORF type:complete len:301 (+),score=81.58 TRINITY_DN21744_c0_g3_i1:33-905(+)